MKYRIKKITQGGIISYRVEERFLFIWLEVDERTQFGGMPMGFVSEKEAREWINYQLSYKEEIILNNNY